VKNVHPSVLLKSRVCSPQGVKGWMFIPRGQSTPLGPNFTPRGELVLKKLAWVCFQSRIAHPDVVKNSLPVRFVAGLSQLMRDVIIV
jgi:hypothetical protein